MIAPPLHVLVVDDDAMMLHMLPPHLEELTLRGAAPRVHAALTPDAALATLDEMPDPAIVLSDFNLKARMNGLDLLAEVGKRRPGSIRILFSGYAMDQLGDVSAATHGFVEKPLRIRDMIDPLQRLIQAALDANTPPIPDA